MKIVTGVELVEAMQQVIKEVVCQVKNPMRIKASNKRMERALKTLGYDTQEIKLIMEW